MELPHRFISHVIERLARPMALALICPGIFYFPLLKAKNNKNMEAFILLKRI